MAQSSTPNQGSVQAGGFKSSGDGSTANNAGQDNFSMSIVPEGNASAKQSKAKSPGAGKPAQAGSETIFEGGHLEEGEGAAGDDAANEASKPSDQNKDGKSQRKAQGGWQQIVEGLTNLNARLDKIEQGKAPGAKEESDKDDKDNKQAKEDNDAMKLVAESIASTNARLDRMDFESDPDNADLKSKDLADQWKKVNSDPKFKGFSLAERADFVRGRAGKSSANTLKDQLGRAEGSMPRGAGGSGRAASGGNPNVTEEDVAVGKAFGHTREMLEEELS